MMVEIESVIRDVLSKHDERLSDDLPVRTHRTMELVLTTVPVRALDCWSSSGFMLRVIFTVK